MLERRPVRFLVIAHTASAPGELAGRFGCREVETVRHLGPRQAAPARCTRRNLLAN